eukprot:3585466-Rhodomonas_salina.2
MLISALLFLAFRSRLAPSLLPPLQCAAGGGGSAQTACQLTRSQHGAHLPSLLPFFPPVLTALLPF